MSEIRKLAAILVADVVGYSRLAGADEERTLARLRGLRGDLALVLALEGKFSEAETVGRTDLSREAAHANVEAIRQMIAQNDSWRELRKGATPAKPKPPARTEDAG